MNTGWQLIGGWGRGLAGNQAEKTQAWWLVDRLRRLLCMKCAVRYVKYSLCLVWSDVPLDTKEKAEPEQKPSQCGEGAHHRLTAVWGPAELHHPLHALWSPGTQHADLHCAVHTHSSGHHQVLTAGIFYRGRLGLGTDHPSPLPNLQPRIKIDLQSQKGFTVKMKPIWYWLINELLLKYLQHRHRQNRTSPQTQSEVEMLGIQPNPSYMQNMHSPLSY